VFLLYNAAAIVPLLVQGLWRQRHEKYERQEVWLRAVFIDDASTDATINVLRSELDRIGRPAHWHVVVNEVNLGLSGTLNKVMRTIRTPFVLTCHCDCLFGSDVYVASALRMLEGRPRVAIITGQPMLHPQAPLAFAEKLNIVANLMDILPPRRTSELVPVAFAEGRCDVFRMSALTEVGFYDSALRTSGEDQLLAADLREKGYEVMQAPGLPYILGASNEQNSLWKLIRHQHLFARTQAYIVLTRGHAAFGGFSLGSSANRTARALLRLSQLLVAPLYLLVALSIVFHLSTWVWAPPIGIALLARTSLFFRQLRAVRPAWHELVGIYAIQPILDMAYAAGFLQGVMLLVRSRRHPIQ
jgi:GT2 family glycosyltransferase